jgi:hypothetical protein
MCARGCRPWWARLCSIFFVISIALPTTAPFQVVGGGEAIRFGLRPRVATPTRTSPGSAVTNQAGVPSVRGQEGRRHRTNSDTAYRRNAMASRARFATSPIRNLPGVFRPLDQQLAVLRI